MSVALLIFPSRIDLKDTSLTALYIFSLPIKSGSLQKERKNMQIKLVDSTIYSVTRADVTDGRLEIDFSTPTAEKLQKIFTIPGNLANIELLTDAGDKFGDLPGWTLFGGVMLNGKTKTVILTKEVDTTVERLVRAEADAIAANATAKAAKELSEDAANQITDLQMALIEIYEGLEVQQSPDQDGNPSD